MFHCFNISKHMSISVRTVFHNFYLTFCIFCWIYLKNCLGVGFWHDFLFVQGRLEGWSGLELTDTLYPGKIQMQDQQEFFKASPVAL